MPIPLGILAAAGRSQAPAGAFQLLESAVLTGSQASVEFTSLGTKYAALGYQHFQIRYSVRKTTQVPGMTVALNGSGLSFVHELIGTGSSVIASATSGNGSVASPIFSPTFVAQNFTAGVMDVLDVFETKNKTIRNLTGYADPVESRIILNSGLWNNTASLTSLALNCTGGNFSIGSRISLYGIRGS